MIAIYPREGTETLSAGKDRGHGKIAIYPREGTETPALPAHRRGDRHCNLSPRGDGNTRARRVIKLTLILQFIPARGRKHGLGHAVIGRRIAIYPREGTETRREGQPVHLPPLQFIPARGRKPAPQAERHRWKLLQFIPARGRKQTARHLGAGTPNCNLSPRGDGNRIAEELGISPRLQFIPARGRKPLFYLHKIYLHDCNLSPRGDGNVRSFSSS